MNLSRICYFFLNTDLVGGGGVVAPRVLFLEPCLTGDTAV